MKKTFILFILLSGYSVALHAQNTQDPRYLDYIARFRDIAISQQREQGIPASITMAQGLLESGAGLSDLATQANNHFGIKCTSDWQGDTYYHDDDRAQECFRKYDHAEQSYYDHSAFLHRSRYDTLFTIPLTDYQSWARGLSRCGYATDPKYPDKLIRIIEDYRLYDLVADCPATISDSVRQAVQEGTILPADTMDIEPMLTYTQYQAMQSVSLYHEHKSGHQNGNRYIIVEEGESFASLAYFLNMSESTLRRINDATDGRVLKAGDRIYLYPKPRRAPRKYANYYVRTGDTAWSISQKFCFRMRTIYDLNGIPYGTPLTTRQLLRLR